ncbi:MAG TPA: ABC transporter ATP-binding protein [Anaerolineae bacterium]|nr:ABC transporter ATP-binding protein [Anaerolineae bacterium]
MSKHPLRRLFNYASGYRRQIGLATVASILNKLFDLAPPALIGLAVDIVVAQDDSILAQWGITNLDNQLIVLAALTVCIWALESLFEYAFALLWRNLAQTLQHDMRLEAYAHVQNLEMSYFEDQSTGGLMAILNDDINQLERFLDSGANEVIQVVTTVITIGAIFIILTPSVAWMALLPMPFVLAGSLLFQKRLAPRYAAVREQVSMLNSQLANNLSGIATIKSFTAEQHEVNRIHRESDIYRQKNQDAIRLSAAFVPLIRMVIVAGFSAILVFGGQLAIAGELNVGAYSVLVFMTQRLLWPLTRLGNTLDLYQRAMASTDRVLDLLDQQPEITSGPQTLAPNQIKGALQLENVHFAYKNGSRVLHGISIDIPAGHTVAIVGATGAGKSTVIKLLLRFYDATQGAVCLDGHDLRQLDLNTIRNTIGLVSQDVFLFHGTVRENIAYGTFETSDEAIIKAAKIAEAHDFILNLPQGYDTIVGERGQKLSGGQRQRISIARAILKDPPILILDEATSSVDNETEAAIQRSLEKIAIGRTTILIAHRLSTVRNADHIFVLENGRLAEEGRHEQLLNQNGIYAALWRVQTGQRLLA